MRIFQFIKYRSYLENHLKNLPKNGRGELTRIADHLRVNTSLLSQVLAGTRDLSPEQGHELSVYLGHSPVETEYFLTLILLERAGTQNFKAYQRQRMELLRRDALKISHIITAKKQLDETERATFYSSWIYSAVHLFLSLKTEGFSVEEVAEHFSQKRPKMVEILRFLVSAGLSIEVEGMYKMGLDTTFVEKGSPHLLKHHSNWRLQAIQAAENLLDEELIFTAQMSVSEADFKILRTQITDLLKKVSDQVKESHAEGVSCLNIDFFWVNSKR